MKNIEKEKQIFDNLSSIYGEKIAISYLSRVLDLVRDLKIYGKGKIDKDLDERDIILITYGDSIFDQTKEKSLITLHSFVNKYLFGHINTIHILPFFPYTSDEGFSIVDYKEVNEKLGTWIDIKALEKDYYMMFDLVANHISKSSKWFKGYKKCIKPYDDFFITCDSKDDYSSVFRPRALPLLTEVETKEGLKNVWTTFSSDQIDLNYKNPDVLLKILEILCFYIKKGATLIRLDAIAFIWKEYGTTCIHNKKTHQIIQLMKLIIDTSKVEVSLITETNVPHKDNISYFGNGYNEASMVYNFSLPPLTLYTFMTKDASILMKWASSLTLPSSNVSFFNFLASHDGIGILPTRGIIENEEVSVMVKKIEDIGGLVSYKTDSNSEKIPYELNVNFFDALKIAGEVDEEIEIARFLASQSILLCLKGVPAIYIHSLIGSRNYLDGVDLNTSKRNINREKIDIKALTVELSNKNSTRYKILEGYKKLLDLRKNNHCFSPKADMKILNNVDERIFAIERSFGKSSIICLTNVSDKKVETSFNNTTLLDGSLFNGKLSPYQIAWIQIGE